MVKLIFNSHIKANPKDPIYRNFINKLAKTMGFSKVVRIDELEQKPVSSDWKKIDEDNVIDDTDHNITNDYDIVIVDTPDEKDKLKLE